MKTIFLVDDEPHNLHVLHNILSGDYSLKALTSGEKCLKLLERLPLPDLILLDVMMPGIDGFEVLKQLQSNSSYASVPVIMVSGLTADSEKHKALDLGAVDFVSKPVQPDTLKSLIKSII